MSKCARCEDARQEVNDAQTLLDVEEAEHNGLAELTRAILNENRALWGDWMAERKRTRKLGRKLAKLKEK